MQREHGVKDSTPGPPLLHNRRKLSLHALRETGQTLCQNSPLDSATLTNLAVHSEDYRDSALSNPGPQHIPCPLSSNARISACDFTVIRVNSLVQGPNLSPQLDFCTRGTETVSSLFTILYLMPSTGHAL